MLHFKVYIQRLAFFEQNTVFANSFKAGIG